MQKIGQLQAYVELAETEDATFVHPRGTEEQSRLIKMRILAEHPVNLYVIPVEYDYDTEQVTTHHDEPEFVRFLAHVEPGLEQVEFFYKGSFCLRLMGGNIWLDTYDNTAFNVESVDPVSFSRLWEREERDPRILEIERAARHNQQILRQLMEADMAAFAARLEAKYQNVTGVEGNGSGQATRTAVEKPESGTDDGTGDTAVSSDDGVGKA